ncbi:AEC family transporter [Cognatishimia sp. SS12]|uniref:AEC family transporter n=1 Tax=Cognatishimia sp. SS12 TaxID=2979465 RepID=UPI002330BBA5|nr:AEC family transporter [Cognatishimia sp. SS12]MDC0737562.1 AEC family transporter [Cognatishimia sp. SS12]
MLAIFLKTLPFFAIIGLGYWAGRTRFFSEEATAYLTKFVFYFALSAMLFRFAANLSLAEAVDWKVIFAYLAGSLLVYLIATAIALWRKQTIPEAAVEAQCAVIGNVGFLGIPMLSLLLGEASLGPNMLVLIVDSVFFASLIVILINVGRDGRLTLHLFKTVALGLIRNPMIVAISTGLIWAGLSLPMPVVLDEFLVLLGAAATPGALFAIGASLASKSAERPYVAGWIALCKLALHPLAVAFFALWVFDVDPFAAAVIITASALPVANNVFILAQHYRVAPQRVSASILITTALSIITVSLVISWVSTLII